MKNSLQRNLLRLGLAAYLGVATLLGVAADLSMTMPAMAACAALPTGNGTATFTVSAPSTTNYRFWAHMYSPSTGNDAMYLQIDNTLCQVTVGNSNAQPAGQFTWVDYQNGNTASKINVSLTAGNHTIELAGLDAGVGVDKVMLLTDTNCVPTGDGSNCVSSATPTPTPTATPSSLPSVTPSPTTVIKPTGTPTAGGGTSVSGVVTLPKAAPDTTRTYYVDGKPVVGNDLDTTALSDGTHTLQIVDRGPNGQTKVTSQKIVVNNKKTWWQLVVTWLKDPLHIALVVGVALLIGAGGFAFWRFRLIQAQAGPVTLDVPPAPTDAPPASPTFYPEATQPTDSSTNTSKDDTSASS